MAPLSHTPAIFDVTPAPGPYVKSFMKLVRALLLLSTAAGLGAESWDASGNGMLNGTYYFRQVLHQLSNAGTGELYETVALYGTLTFDGAGNYSGTAAFAKDGQSQSGTIKGTYSIAASGQGFLSNPMSDGDSVHGMVNAQGIFVGSSTENAGGYNDLFIAAPLSSPAPVNSTFKGSYTLAYMDFSAYEPRYTVGATLRMNPDGAGNVGSVPVTAYVGQNGSASALQSLSNVKYRFSGGAAVVTFPNSQTAFFAGDYYLYFSPDGNFVFGGSPYYSDLLVGVRAGTGTPSLSGRYYEAGLDQDLSTLLTGGFARSMDSFYGSFNAGGGTVVGHQRLLYDSFNPTVANGTAIGSSDYTYADTYTVAANGTYASSIMNYWVGNGIRIGSGVGPYLGISVALQAPTMNSSLRSTGVFLNPQGVVNAGSFAPFTAALAPGELITLFGENLASGIQVAPGPSFPTTLGKVQVAINGVYAPICSVYPNQISAVVPYGVTGTVAKVQVFNNNVPSNVVTSWISQTSPGVLTQSQNGIGYGDALHNDGSMVNDQKPAQIGETVALFLTGLGVVSPIVNDGAPGPTNPFAETPADAITAYIGGTQAAVQYSGLAPGLPGLYQLNLTVPAGVTAGNHYLDIVGPDAYSSVCLIAIGGTTASSATATTTATTMAAPRSRKTPNAVPGRGARVPRSR